MLTTFRPAAAALFWCMALAQLAGCATETVWRHADQSFYSTPRVIGFVSDRDQPRGALLIGYGLWDRSTELQVKIPITSAGTPMPPFNTTEPIVEPKDLPAIQQRQILASCPDGATVQLQYLALIPGQTPTLDRTPGVVGPWNFNATDSQKINPLYYRIQSGNAIGMFNDCYPVSTPAIGSPTRRAEDFHLVLVPKLRPRPVADRNLDLIGASLATPFTLAWDIPTTIILAPYLFWPHAMQSGP